VEAVARELVGRDVGAQSPRLDYLGQEVSDHVAYSLLRLGDVLVAMQERPQFGVVPSMRLVGDERVGLEYGVEPLARVTGLVANFNEIVEVPADLAFVPGEQNRFDAREVLVQRRASDAGLLGDLRHRHRPQPVGGRERRCGVQYRLPYLSAMHLHRLVPELRHRSSIRGVRRRDTVD
jgi:hypothetical protein